MKKNSREYINEIGIRIKQYRINMEMTQQELADKAGISSRSVLRLEQGETVQLENFIRVLSALGIEDNLELLIPDQTKRPSYYLNNEIKKRARKKKTNLESGNRFKWGDEE